MQLFRRETLVERLAREAGWLIAEREGDFYRVRPNDGSAMRYVQIRYREDKDFASFITIFPVGFPLGAVTPSMATGLLFRNRPLFFGRWCMEIVGSCEVRLFLAYSAPVAGLDAASFNTICRELVAERESLHDELRGSYTGTAYGSQPPARTLRRYDADASSQGIVWLGG